MLLIDPKYTDTQRIGRMGELMVELELIARGWHVGNFNASVNNSAGWDLFGAREGHSIKIRVKAKRPGTICFRWSAKADGRVLLGLNEDDPTDFVAAVSFESDGSHKVFVVPSAIVERELAANHAAYLAQPKRDGSPRKDSSQRNLFIDDDTDRPGHGYGVRWSRFEGAWSALEGSAELLEAVPRRPD